MSDAARLSRRPLHVLGYAVVVLAILFELAVVWVMLHPQVPADYRAYYIDQSTTCLNQPVSGAYAIGSVVSFRPGGVEQAKALRVCGWEGPAGDGTHAVGETARLRFAIDDATAPLTLELELVAVQKDGYPAQRVGVEANGVLLDTVTANAGEPLVVALDIPAAVLAESSGTLEVALQFPDAIRMAPTDSDTRLRSIKLLSARLSPVQP